MFWRRRKLPEDDDPLVPHGLIWQATEPEGATELPPDMWENSPNAVQGSPAEPVEMPVRMSVPAEPSPSQDQTASESPRIISPPVKWPSLDEAEIARRSQGVDTPVSFPYRRPLVGSAIPKPIEPESEVEFEPAAQLELVAVSPSTPLRAARTEKFRNLVLKFRIGLTGLTPAWKRIRTADLLDRIKDHASLGAQATNRRLDLLRQKSLPALSAAKITLWDGSKALISQSRVRVEHFRDRVRGLDLSGVGRLWARARSFQLVVRIPVSNRRFIATIVEHTRASRLRAQRMLPRDSRLWSSLGMAGISALLAVGVISALRHYAPERAMTQPASQTVQAASSGAKVEIPVSSASKPVAESTQSKPSPVAGSVKEAVVAKPTPVETPRKVTAAVVPHRKPRRRNTDEDDYVAKNTYVFYGNAGKPRR